MQRKNIISIVICAIMVGGALLYKLSQNEQSHEAIITQEQLHLADGKDGRDCWLAVDGVVYEIDQGYKWLDGEHTESSLAYCGADMSSVIDQAPHGRTKLSQLKKIGSLQH